MIIAEKMDIWDQLNPAKPLSYIQKIWRSSCETSQWYIMLGQKLKAFQKIDNTYVLLDGHRKQRRKRKRISYLNLLDKNTRL